jgi:spermidine synthase
MKSLQAEAERETMAYLLGVFLTSLGLIALEIGITRVFSTMIWYHLSFLAISLAMLGFSLGGILLLVFPSIVRPERKNALPLCAFLFALSLAAGTLYIYFQPSVIAFFRQAFSLGPNRASVLYFLVMLLLFICTFVLSGLTLSTAISRQASEISRVYFANLLGSGLGCLLIIVMLSRLGAFKALLIVALLAAAASVCFMDRLRRSSPLLYGLNGALILALLLPLFLTRPDAIFARSLFTRRDVTDENRLYRKWNSFSCVDFYKPEKESQIVYDGEQASAYYEGLWGLSRRYEGKMLDPIKVIIDSWAITSINKVEPDTLDLDIYDYLPTNLAYQIKTTPKVLIMGAGGGIDVLSALHYKARHIRAVEINPTIVEAVREKFAEYAGHIYDRPDVEVIVAEGRHYINKDTDTYDLIQLSGVDTLSGAQASSYSFSESYLYTLEAFEEYLNHLESDGIVTFLRFAFKKPREMLRLFTTAAEALRRQGVQDVGKHMIVVHSNVLIFANIMVKKSPFSPEEVAQIEKVVEDKGFRFLYNPYSDGDNEYYAFLRSGNWRQFYEAYPYRIYPVTDDDPFFFNYTKLGSVLRLPEEKLYWLYWVGQTILFYGLLFVLVLSILFVFLPLFFYRKRTIPGRNRFLLYFLGLGLAFMFVEILLMQRFTLFLGQPIYSLALVLFSLLVFAGLGSYVTRGLAFSRTRTILTTFGLLALTLVATYLATGPLFRSMIKQDIWVRVVLSVALLAPPSFLMGFPFPLAVRLADRIAQPMVPWGWAVNGYASVVGSFLSVLLGLSLGFTKVYFIAIVIYGLSGLLLLSLCRDFSED